MSGEHCGKVIVPIAMDPAGIQTERFGLAVFAENMRDRGDGAEIVPAIEFGGPFVSPRGLRLIGVAGSAKY